MSKFVFDSYFEYIASYDDLCEFLTDKLCEDHDENIQIINSYAKFHYEIIGIDQLEKGTRMYKKFDYWNYLANFPENIHQYYDTKTKTIDAEKLFYNYITVGYPNKLELVTFGNPRNMIEDECNKD